MTRRWLTLILLLGAAVALGERMTFEEHAAVQESLSRVHPRMRASWLRAHGLDDSYYTTFRRPESNGLSCIGRWPWGPSWELAGKDTFLYLGSGSGVRILSIADSVQPRMLGQINARGLVSQVVVQESLLFVACGSWGAQIYSVSDPATPRELGAMDAVIGDVCVKDTFCYAVGGDSFRIYNFANPAQPMQVAAVSDSGGIVVEANGYAYVGYGGSGLNVYDVRNPHSPTLANTLGGAQLALFIRGQLLFRTSVQPSYFQILDISDPTSVHEVGRIDGYGGHALYADDYFAYLSCSYDHQGLFVIDITNPASPQLRDSLNPEGNDNWDPYVPVPLSYGYLASDFGGLATVDLHNVNAVSEAWSGYKADQSTDVVIDGARAYVANNLSGMQILNVGNPALPTLIGLFDTAGQKYTYTVTAHDSFSFTSMSGIPGRKFLRVLDVRDPVYPTVVAQESCFNPPQDMVLRDSFIYLAEMNQFQVFNVARPREPVRVGSCNSTDGNFFGLAVQDSLAFVASLYGMWVIDISRPDSPFVASSNVGRNAAGVAGIDTLVYLPYVYDTLLTYSVANPANPRLLASVKTGVWPSDITLGGTRGYVALNGGDGVETFDLTNPALPVSRGQTSAPYAVRRVCYSNGLVYAAMWEAGVAVYETTSVGIDERPSAAAKSPGLRVWPDITGGKVRFAVGITTRAAVLAVFDISGKRLDGVRQQATMKGGATEGVIDLTGLAAGVYVIRVDAEKKSFTAKVVKTNRR